MNFISDAPGRTPWPRRLLALVAIASSLLAAAGCGDFDAVTATPAPTATSALPASRPPLAEEDESWKSQYEGTRLDFIARTGRIVVHENGTKELVFETPTPITLEESMRMMEAAKAARDHELLPLYTPEYMEYARENNKKWDEPPLDFWEAPGCVGIPDRIMFGPPSGPASLRPREHAPSGDEGSGLLFAYDTSGEFAAGIVDLKSGPTMVDIAGAGYRPGERVRLRIETGSGSTALQTETEVAANLNGAFFAMGVRLPSSIREGDVATIKATGDQGTVAVTPLAAINKNLQN